MAVRAVVIDYGAGNLRSVTKALEHVATQHVVRHPSESWDLPPKQDSCLRRNDTLILATDAAQLTDATHIILPGVGAFGDCMRGLQALPGMIAALEKRVLQEGVPFLGICVGMQMLLQRGHEHGTHQGLGWFEGEVMPLTPQELKVPHMGWNEIVFEGGLTPPASPPLPLRASPCSVTPESLFENISSGDHVYFVHSYHCAMQHEKDILATTDYGGAVTAAIGRDNILGVQFHPEKSQRTGLQLFQNFLNMRHHASSC